MTAFLASRKGQHTFVAEVSSGWRSMKAASLGLTPSRFAASCAFLTDGCRCGAPACHQAWLSAGIRQQGVSGVIRCMLAGAGYGANKQA